MAKSSNPSESSSQIASADITSNHDPPVSEYGELSLEEIKSILMPIAAKCNVHHVSLFGSRARGDHNPDSDYDFLIDVGENFSYGDYGLFIDQTTEALGKPVDVITCSSLKKNEFDLRILREELNVF